ncbi:unnamed protein product [Rotaria sordida]|uniref:Septin-type G domain-containing protein n=2 Tax=Rotaria sordida TaxID=392033 RepID=A0A814LUN6_9BILA|nr:unnamed protein product [Rotaria sordida]
MTRLQPLHQPVPQPLHQPVPQPLRQPVPQPLHQPVPQPLHQPILQPLHQPVPQPLHQPVPQPLHQPILQQQRRRRQLLYQKDFVREPIMDADFFCSFYDNQTKNWNDSGCSRPIYNAVWDRHELEDEVHSDFIALRSMLIRTNLNDLRDVTHNIHYENYRYKKLSSFHGNDTKNGKTLQTPSVNKNFLSQIEDERIETETRLEKMSRDMEAVYQSKVTEKLQKLDESKQNVLKTQETYRLNIQQEEERIQLKREEFERARREWEESLAKTGFVADQIGSLTKTAKKKSPITKSYTCL